MVLCVVVWLGWLVGGGGGGRSGVRVCVWEQKRVLKDSLTIPVRAFLQLRSRFTLKKLHRSVQPRKRKQSPEVGSSRVVHLQQASKHTHTHTLESTAPGAEETTFSPTRCC